MGNNAMREYGFRSPDSKVVLSGGWFDQDGLGRILKEITDSGNPRFGWTVVFRDFPAGDELLEAPGEWEVDQAVPVFVAKQSTERALEILQEAEDWLSGTEWTVEDDEMRKLLEELSGTLSDVTSTATNMQSRVLGAMG